MEYISGLLSTALRSRGKKSINFVLICFGKSPVILLTCCCTTDLFQLTFQVWRSQFLLLVTQMTSSGHSIHGFEQMVRLTWPQQAGSQDCLFHRLTARNFFKAPPIHVPEQIATWDPSDVCYAEVSVWTLSALSSEGAEWTIFRACIRHPRFALWNILVLIYL